MKWEKPVEAVKAAPGAIPKGQGQKHVVTYVGDGDGFKTQSGLECRIDTIDAPETAKSKYGKSGQPYGAEAQKTLEQMILNKEANIRIVRSADKHGRAICQVEIEGKGLDHMMVAEGAAWVFDYFAKDTLRFTSLKQAEAAAKKDKKGLWVEPNPENPLAFKQRTK